MTGNDVPLACTLTGVSYRERAQSLEALARDGLLRDERDDLRLTLHYREEARDRVERMVAQEAECCAFLQFDARDLGEEIEVTVTAPESARLVVDSLFDLFTTDQRQSACSCGARGNDGECR